MSWIARSMPPGDVSMWLGGGGVEDWETRTGVVTVPVRKVY